MREYNFDENKSMGETVRIDDIKNKLNEMGEQDTQDVDFDNYDDLYEPYSYDDTEDYGETTELPPIKETPRGGGKKNPNPRKDDSFNKGRLIVIIIVAVFAVAVVMASVAIATRSGKKDQDNIQENADCRYSYGVVVSVNENKFEIIDTETGETSMYTVNKNMTVTMEDGKPISGTSVSRGDIAYFGISKETDEIVSIEYTDTVWEKNGFGGIEINSDKHTISNGVVTYKYDNDAIFIYNGDFIDAEDLCDQDVVTLKGIKETVWSVWVEKYHGFVKLENVDKIENAEITIDGEKVAFVDNMAPVSAGSHTLGIYGSNVDKLTVDIHIAAGEIYPIDMAAVQEKTGVLTLNVNVDNCIIVVDGKQVDKESPVVLSMGTYQISISAEGYKTYNGTVDINEPLVQLDIEMEKLVQQKAILSVDSNPQGATVYANDTAIGVTPFMAQIDFGDYKITLVKDGYKEYSVNTTVAEEQKTISVLLTEE